MKLLTVDDSSTVREIIKSSLEVLGYEILEAADGSQAQNAVENNDGIGLILLDWNMPVMDGMTFLRWLKGRDAYKHIPVTMVTTEIERPKVIEAIEAGARNYVMKPFSQDDLVSKVLQALGMGI